MEEVRWGERPNAQAGEPCCRERRLQRGEDSCRAWRAHPDPQQLHHLWARCRHHLVVQEARQARACKVVDLDEIPLEEEEEWTFEPERLQLSVEVRCPGPEGDHLASLEAKGIVSQGRVSQGRCGATFG